MATAMSLDELVAKINAGLMSRGIRYASAHATFRNGAMRIDIKVGGKVDGAIEVGHGRLFTAGCSRTALTGAVEEILGLRYIGGGIHGYEAPFSFRLDA